MNRLLVVDDERWNIDTLREQLEGEDYAIDDAMDGAEAWEALSAEPGRYARVVLDRRMPRLDGMQVLQRMRDDPAFAATPVVMQTSVTAAEAVAEGLRAGAFYYLAKPCAREVLRAVIAKATRHAELQRRAAELQRAHGAMMRMTERAEFRFRDLADARTIAAAVAGMCPNPQAALLGLVELAVNAIEHGTLGIGYEQKSALTRYGNWEEEIRRRLAQEPYAGRSARLGFERAAGEILITVEDEGAGFDWRRYLELDPVRASESLSACSARRCPVTSMPSGRMPTTAPVRSRSVAWRHAQVMRSPPRARFSFSPCDAPGPSIASRRRAATSSRLSGRTVNSKIERPMASSARQPKARSAAGFQIV